MLFVTVGGMCPIEAVEEVVSGTWEWMTGTKCRGIDVDITVEFENPFTGSERESKVIR